MVLEHQLSITVHQMTECTSCCTASMVISGRAHWAHDVTTTSTTTSYGQLFLLLLEQSLCIVYQNLPFHFLLIAPEAISALSDSLTLRMSSLQPYAQVYELLHSQCGDIREGIFDILTTCLYFSRCSCNSLSKLYVS